jgi:UDP-N-acetylmuramate: L-alanyl-gamma-D-glutamyl-meso-diaminopimelate ligase
MKLGAMKVQLPDSLTQADLVFCHTAGLDWDAAAALLPVGQRATCTDNIDELVRRVTRAALAGDRIVCMSNGGFSGIHDKLLDALQAKFA